MIYGLTSRTVGRFEIRDFVGRGRFGDVFLAWDPQRQAEVALKIVRADRTDPDMLEAERNGAALQAQLAQVVPQVAAVYEQGEEDSLFWVAMEYIAGTDLSQVLGGGPLPEGRALAIAHQLLAMLEVCHELAFEVGGRRGVIHGDIKPENIRLQDGDRVRVLDFGIAKNLSQTRRFTVNLFGSLPYTPPERLERGVVDRHSDLWAVAVVLYITVSGQRPFPGEAPEEIERRIRAGEPPLPLPASCSPALKRFLARALAHDVERRYPSAAAMKADLEAVAEGRPLADDAEGALPAEATRRTVRPAAAPGSHPEATRRTERAVAPETAAEATRRTREPEALPAPPPSPSPPLPPLPAAAEPLPPPVPAPAAPRARPGRFGRLLLLALVLAFAGTQLWARREARQVRHELLTAASPDLDALRERYRRAARLTPFGLGMGDTGEELRQALLRSADRILEAYHGDTPVSSERGWRRAYEHLRAALEIDYEREVRARMVYARAHLDRIDGQALRARGQQEAAREAVREAIGGFRDAARRDSDWPDPYLGLARIYAYEQFDMDALQDALAQLSRRGYRTGRRETAMLADAYRMQGKSNLGRALRLEERDERFASLDKARQDLEKAVALYDEIPGYANAGKNRAEAEANLSEVTAQLWELGFW